MTERRKGFNMILLGMIFAYEQYQKISKNFNEKERRSNIMANENASKSREVLVSFTDSQKLLTADGKPNGALIIPQKNQSMVTDKAIADGSVKPNNYLVNTPKTDEAGKKTYNHSISVSEDQLQKMLAAAGDNKIVDGNKTTLAFKAELIKAQSGKVQGYMPNTAKDLEASDYTLTPESLARQKEVSTKAWKVWEQAKAEKSAKTETKSQDAPAPKSTAKKEAAVVEVPEGKHELFVKFSDKQLLTDKETGKPNGAYIVPQFNQSMLSKAALEKGEVATNTNLVNKPGRDGGRVNHSVKITEDELQGLIAAAGDNKLTDKNGVTVLGVKAELEHASSTGKSGLKPNAATAEASDYKLTKAALTKQDNKTREAISQRDTKKAQLASAASMDVPQPVDETEMSAEK